MGVKWTKQQQQVIDLRDRNILVSAAAGSGKTAVLVERIITMLTDEEHPVNVDELLIVTFTEAAAGEMKERIRGAIEKALEENPENEHLKRQATLIHNAQITTIHSFCLSVIRDHFHVIDIDPGFRTAEEGELKLLRHDVLDELLEEKYAQKEERFLRFSNAYGGRRNDKKLEEMIEKAYDYSRSYPDGEGWLDSCVDAYRVDCVEDLEKSDYGNKIVTWAKAYLEEAKLLNEQATQISLEIDGPAVYEEALKLDAQTIRELLSAKNYNELSGRIQNIEWSRFASCRDKTVSKEKIEAVKDLREQVKGIVSGLKKDYFYQKPEEMAADMQICLPYMEELVGLVKCFSQRFDAKKRQENVIDFSDMEQFALQILAKKTEEGFEPSEVAKEYQDQFREIMIDEYQDSNLIQETILTSISGVSKGKYNIFMVGDVKQSIYSFRQACPEIFMDKYERFHGKEEGNIAIDLHQNFRSREEVLSFTNDVFYQLMHKDIGNVEYDDLAALYPGASYYPKADTDTFQTEILIASRNQEEMEEAGIEDNISFEAKMIADKIHRMQGHQLVTDKKTGELRPMRYRDVVILLRSPGAMAEDMIAVLEENGIPAFTENKTGYYDAMEVQTVLNLLRIIDNPRQDIPFAAVLHSAMFAFSSDEIAKIRMTEKKSCLLEAMEAYRDAHPMEQKVGDFLEFLAEMRALVADTPIHAFMEMLLQKTGYLTYVTAMPRGESRRANLEKLIDQAVMYENTSYKGLFQFINYIGQLQKYEVNEGEAQLISDHDDAVAIMSIHKSKGLEFPIVFVSGMGKQFNTQDQKGQMLLHKDMGVGLDLVDYDAQTKTVPLYKQVVARALHSDACGEEMRVLYVALTRAKEKLILTATLNKAEETLEKWQENRGVLTFSEREEAQGYLEWIIRATAAKRELYPITVVKAEEVILEEVAGLIEKQQKKEALPLLAGQAKASWVEALDAQMQYVYPYEQNGAYKNKYSVSEIKHRQMEKAFADDFSERPDFLQEKAEPIVPSFITKTEKDEVSRGALRGTAMHRFLECFDFSNYDSEKNMYEQLETMCQSGRLREEQRELLQMDRIHRFLESKLAKRMKTAARKNQLYVEKPFVMSVTPKELFLEENDSEDTVLVQGIVDVFFVEEDGIVLLDYKTDRVKEAEELTKRYQAQLQLYAKALQRTMDLPVKEIWIYSFYLEKMIAL